MKKKTAVKKTPKPRRGDCLVIGFRVPTNFQRRFKTYAASRGLRMNQLLQQLFEAREAQDAA
jgi:hypothetical protein